MDINEYVDRAADTDHMGDNDDALRIGVMGIAGEAGTILSLAKKSLRDGTPLPGIKDILAEELGDLLWYIALVTRHLGLDLNDIAVGNLHKTAELWCPQPLVPSSYDDHPYEAEKFLRRVSVKFEEYQDGDVRKVRIIPLGSLGDRIYEARGKHQIGDDIDDNASTDDGYRYHDIIHLAHMTVLGWSPVLRALMGAKRKHIGDCDRVEDGARAIAVEESLVAFVFNYLSRYDFDPRAISWDLVRYIRWIVRGLEVRSQPVAAWRSVYTQAFSIFSHLRKHHGGTVECDLDRQKLTYNR